MAKSADYDTVLGIVRGNTYSYCLYKYIENDEDDNDAYRIEISSGAGVHGYQFIPDGQSAFDILTAIGLATTLELGLIDFPRQSRIEWHRIWKNGRWLNQRFWHQSPKTKGVTRNPAGMIIKRRKINSGISE